MKKSTEQLYIKRVMHVLVHIQNNLDQDLTLEELSREAYFSQYHFHRVFSALVGETLNTLKMILRKIPAGSGSKERLRS